MKRIQWLLLSLFVGCIMIPPKCLSTNLDSLKRAYANDPGNGKLLFSICEAYGDGFKEFDSLRYYARIMEGIGKEQNPELFELGRMYRGMSYYMEDTARFYAILDSVIAKGGNSRIAEIAGMACRQVSVRCRTTDAYDRGIVYCKNGLRILEKSPKRNWWPEFFIEFKLHNNLSSFYTDLGKFHLSLEHALISKKFAERSGNTYYRLLSAFNLSGLYGELGSSHITPIGVEGRREDFEEQGKNYMLTAYRLAKVLNRTRSEGVAAYNLGVFYSNIPRYDSTEYFLQEAISAGKRADYLELLSNAYNVLGGSLLEQKRFEEAEPLLVNALEYAELLSFPRPALTAKYSLSSLFLEKGQLNKAKTFIEDGLAIAQEIDNPIKISRGYYFLYRWYEARGDFEQALTHYKQHMELQRDIVGEENMAQIDQLREAFDAENRELTIAQLSQTAKIQELEIKQKNTLLYGAGALILMLALLSYLWRRQRSLKDEKKILKVENKFLRFQLNPHFFFHALNSIQNFIMDNSPGMAVGYLAKISKLMRQVLEHSREDFVPLEQEIDMLKNYLDLQRLRYSESFTYDIQIDEEIQDYTIHIPPMFIQPFVENSLEHGLRNATAKGKIHIGFHRRDHHILVHIQDNGIGFSQSISLHEEHPKRNSLATTIIKERIQLINKGLKEKIHVEIRDRTDLQGVISGTQVDLTLPFQYSTFS